MPIQKCKFLLELNFIPRTLSLIRTIIDFNQIKRCSRQRYKDKKSTLQKSFMDNFLFEGGFVFCCIKENHRRYLITPVVYTIYLLFKFYELLKS